jgi:predicted dehydrogenase
MIGALQADPDEWETSGWIRTRDAAGNVRGGRVKVAEEVENVTLELKDFVETVRNGRQPSITLEAGYRALSLCLAAVTATQTGKPEVPRRF